MKEEKYILIEQSELKALIKEAVADALAEHTTCTSINTREEDDLIGTSEACRILGCSTRTMQNYRDGKLVPFIKVGPHKAMYYRKDIEAFRDSHRVETRQIINHL